jgi:cellulose biosynthesis protein BcsQ
MKSIAIFNNKGGVGKTTLTYHLGYALAELGYRTLLVDLDPQSNLTLYGLTPEELHEVWKVEDAFIDDFVQAQAKIPTEQFNQIAANVRSIHFLLKPTEDGVEDFTQLSHPLPLHENLGLIPGRLSMHLFEDIVASKWNEFHPIDSVVTRMMMRIRQLCIEYAERESYEFILVDTAPSLGILNKVIVSTVDGFIMPCMPDMFSLYGIRHIGEALKGWLRDFGTIFNLLPERKMRYIASSFVSFLGFTLVEAKKSEESEAIWNQISTTIREYFPSELWQHLSEEQLELPIDEGGISLIDSSQGFSTTAQRHKKPIWKVGICTNLDRENREAIYRRNKAIQHGYHVFAKHLLTRLQQLEADNG